jgi:thiol-disulfide isomerase/thioredoxin
MKSLFVLSVLLVGFVAATPLSDVPEKPEGVKPLLIGQTIPDITLATVEGGTVSLRAEVAKKPTILVFYRGGWCPFC